MIRRMLESWHHNNVSNDVTEDVRCVAGDWAGSIFILSEDTGLLHPRTDHCRNKCKSFFDPLSVWFNLNVNLSHLNYLFKVGGGGGHRRGLKQKSTARGMQTSAFNCCSWEVRRKLSVPSHLVFEFIFESATEHRRN